MAKYRYDVQHNGLSESYDYEEFNKQYNEVAAIMEKHDLRTLQFDSPLETIRVDMLEVIDNLCTYCDKNTLVEVCSKSSDMNHFKHRHREYDGYVLKGMGIGEGDYIEFTFCTQCGQIQGNFPSKIHGALITRDTDGYKKGGTGA